MKENSYGTAVSVLCAVILALVVVVTALVCVRPADTNLLEPYTVRQNQMAVENAHDYLFVEVPATVLDED